MQTVENLRFFMNFPDAKNGLTGSAFAAVMVLGKFLLV